MLDVMELLVSGERLGLPLEGVIEIAPRVHVRPLPGVSGALVGYLGYRGDALPVVDLRIRFGHEPTAAVLDEHIVIARTARRSVALLVDRVTGMRQVDPLATTGATASADAVAGIVALEDGLLFITDLDALLSLEEERAVDEALSRLPGS